MLETIEQHARDHQMHKLILFTFPFNKIGQKLYIRSGGLSERLRNKGD
nr:hypothetical protein [Exiguobacterium sp. SL14]